jgi:hypothetical protein
VKKKLEIQKSKNKDVILAHILCRHLFSATKPAFTTTTTTTTTATTFASTTTLSIYQNLGVSGLRLCKSSKV